MNELAPGCFGSLLAFDEGDAVCLTCKHFGDCEDRRHEVLMNLRESLNVEKLINSHNIRRVKGGKTVIEANPDVVAESPKPRGEQMLTKDQILTLDAIKQKKARETAIRLFKRGVDVDYMKKALSGGVNPLINQTPAFVASAFDMLLSGGFTRANLAERFVAGGMSNQTAYSHVAIVVAMLPGLDLAQESEDGTFKLT